MPLIKQPAYRIVGKRAPMLLPQLELALKLPLVRHSHDVFGLHTQIREPLPALDPARADIGAQVKVGRKLALRYGYLEGPSTGDCRYSVPAGGGDLPTRGRFLGDYPASHRDLQIRH